MTDIDIKPGEYLVITADGQETRMEGKISCATVERLIRAEALDTVCLRKKNGVAEIIMMVDDTGMIDHKPVNSKATALYRSICRPGTVFAIHGDVVIVNDKDFA